MTAHEVEIKFRIDNIDQIRERLRQTGFTENTPRTHEINTLYDHLGRLRSKGSILRLRKYGERWVLTHKGKAEGGKHKARVETETQIREGEKMDYILKAIGYEPSFRYEKFRSEWSDGTGHVVLDETPIGNMGEIEGTPEWIDRIAAQLQVTEDKYITKSYAELFRDWCKETRSKAKNMTFEEVRHG